MKLLIAAGGTGGHIFPGVAVGQTFAADSGNEVFFTGTSYGLEDRLIPSYGFRLLKVEAKPFYGRSPLTKVKTLLTLLHGMLQARGIIKKERPQAILGMGGFTSVPVLLAGLQMHVPCFIHEQNVFPGMANKLLARRVRATFVSFAETGRYIKAREVIHTGLPVRKTMRGKRTDKKGDDFNVFIFGGSRGARSINDAVLALLPYLEAFRHTSLSHQTGTEDFERIRAGYSGSSVAHDVFPFTDVMENYYNNADIVVARAGASTIFELSYFRKPAIFVPYPFSAGGHQWKNAAYVESVGGAYVIGNSELSGERLYTALTELRENPEELTKMGQNIGTIYIDGAEERVIRGIQASVS